MHGLTQINILRYTLVFKAFNKFIIKLRYVLSWLFGKITF